MDAAPEVVLLIEDTKGIAPMRLRISALPADQRLGQTTLWQARRKASSGVSEPAFEILEASELRFEWLDVDPMVQEIRLEPGEIFQPDTVSGRTGRLRPGLSTGLVSAPVLLDGKVVGIVEFEVRSRKLDYRSEYQWMLRDIASYLTELVMNRFATSEAQFELDEARDALTLYQRFAFLKSLIASVGFQSAIGEILRRPHVSWITHSYVVRPGAPMHGSSSLIRQISRPGPRRTWGSGPVPSIPERLERAQTEATHDTTPNRFVKFALEHWMQELNSLDDALLKCQERTIVARGRREIADVLTGLSDILRHDFLKKCGRLARFPADDQTLQKRAGYREVFKAYQEFEFASKLSWASDDPAFRAGQRDVAALYEQWAFLQLADIVSKNVGRSFDVSPLIHLGSQGLNVMLQTGKASVLKGITTRHGRDLHVELWFNRSFPGRTQTGQSWSRTMRPDYSVHVYPVGAEPLGYEAVFIHFDAKYRVDFITELFGSEEDPVGSSAQSGVGDSQTLRRGVARRDDLLKMHAYRDAIRRTVGAYVLYPGTDEGDRAQQYSEYHELLPGLGAFVLKPERDGAVLGKARVAQFLDDVLDHLALQFSEHERSRYWLSDSYRQSVPSYNAASDDPPPDTQVLLGFVKSDRHWAWVQNTRTYNLRAQGRVGGVAVDTVLWHCSLLLLYCPQNRGIQLARVLSLPRLVSESSMKGAGYPGPQGSYWCVQINPLPDTNSVRLLCPNRVSEHLVRSGLAFGAPTHITWQDLIRSCHV